MNEHIQGFREIEKLDKDNDLWLNVGIIFVFTMVPLLVVYNLIG